MTDNLEDSALRFYEAFQPGREALADLALAPTWVDNTLPPGRAPGVEGMKNALRVLTTALPDLTVDIQEMIVAGDLVSVRLWMHGTHLGSFTGLPPSGKEVGFLAFDMHRILRGRVVESWHLEDNLSFLLQVGVIPPLPF